jgi:hypothetical protein
MTRRFTEEDRTKSAAAKRAVKENTPYRADWLDDDFWVFLASKRELRLPHKTTPPTPSALRRWQKTIRDVPFKDAFGCSPQELIAMNPTMGLRAFVGQMLEQAE